MEAPSSPSEPTGKETIHWTKRPAWIALHFRQPSIKIFGNLRTAVAKGALAVGLYSIIVGIAYLARILGRETYGGEYFVDAICMFACIVAIVDAFLHHACKKQKNEAHLERLLRATMILYKIDVPLSVVAYFVAAVISIDILPFWILLRIITCIFHMCLMYCLLVELRENKKFPSSDREEEEQETSPTAPTQEDAEQGISSPSAPVQEETEQGISSPSVPVQEETEQGVTSPNAPLEPTTNHHGAKVSGNVPKKQHEGDGDLAPP